MITIKQTIQRQSYVRSALIRCSFVHRRVCLCVAEEDNVSPERLYSSVGFVKKVLSHCHYKAGFISTTAMKSSVLI